MSAKKIDFTALEGTEVTWTLLGTLYLRAWDSRSKQSILKDHFAAEALDRIEYDFEKLKKKLRPETNQFLVALRATQFDTWASDFLAKHPGATVLQLGCGLDSRVFRLSLPADVRWFDVDIPLVIDLRRQLYPDHAGYQTIGSSVTDPGWLEKIPNDRPTLIIAEGLLMYLEEKEVRQLLQRLTDYFPSGELIFDGMAPWLKRINKIAHWAISDPAEIERMNPRLKLVEEASWATLYAKIPVPLYRNIYRFSLAVPAFRNIFRHFRFAF